MKKSNAAGCGLGCLHFVATNFIYLLAITGALYQRNPRYRVLPPHVITQEKVGQTLQPLFEFPLMTVARYFWGKEIGGYGLLIWIVNSLLFGFCFVFIMKKMREKR
jgi:hypothetical protein